MTAYVIYHQTKIHDADAYEREYLGAARASIAKYGGRQLVGGTYEVLEGDLPGVRMVVHEFPDMETLKRWYHSDEFQPLAAIRQRVADGTFVIADGFVPAA